MKRRSTLTIAAIGLGGALVTAGALGIDRSTPTAEPTAAVAVNQASGQGDVAATVSRIDGSSLDTTIETLQARLEATPDDHASWATLGLAYVQQARITVNPDFYPKAEGALDRSFEIDDHDNFLGYAGRSALASARHDFSAARDFAERGLEINAYSPLLYGALSDAEIQLGEYDRAIDTVQRMLDLSPDTASLSRASYTWELRGDPVRAAELMQRALDDAPTDADRTFALHHLAALAFDSGDANRALELELQALEFSPDDPAARFGRAMAEAALGQTETALDHLSALVLTVPEPGYLVYYGSLLESVGRIAEADAQYAVVGATRALFAAQGVLPDSDAVLFDVRSGNVEQAVADAEIAMTTRPFLAMHDAYAWALHAAGRDDEALVQIEMALRIGTQSALYRYHAGMIRLGLGDEVGARNDLAMALSINPFFDPLAAPLAAQQLQQLQQLGGGQ
jgi:tetratricopeptide (TPR) repeat protein